MIVQDIEKQITHQRMVVTRHGGPEVLQAIDEPIPTPRTGEARVRVLAAGVSAYDLMLRSSGLLPGTPKPPFTIGEDIVGIVDKLGEGVNSVEAFGAEDRGFDLFAPERYRSPTVTCVTNSLKVDITALNRHLRSQGMIISNGYGPLKSKTFRIAHMGDLLMPELEELLAAIDTFIQSK